MKFAGFPRIAGKLSIDLTPNIIYNGYITMKGYE